VAPFFWTRCSSSSSSSRNEYYLGGIIALMLQDHRTMSMKSVCSTAHCQIASGNDNWIRMVFISRRKWKHCFIIWCKMHLDILNRLGVAHECTVTVTDAIAIVRSNDAY